MDEQEILAFVAALPNKGLFYVGEVVPQLSRVMDITENAARLRLYRGICDGRIEAWDHMGTMRIPRREVVRILTGEKVT